MWMEIDLFYANSPWNQKHAMNVGNQTEMTQSDKLLQQKMSFFVSLSFCFKIYTCFNNKNIC